MNIELLCKKKKIKKITALSSNGLSLNFTLKIARCLHIAVNSFSNPGVLVLIDSSISLLSTLFSEPPNSGGA
jgi:hypothetical protein